MTTSYKGEFTLGQILPLPATVQADYAATLGVMLPDLNARIAGLLEVTLRPPPALADLIASAENLLSALQALLAAPLPDVSASLSLLADLQAELGQINGRLALNVGFGDFLSAAGVHFYLFQGKAPEVGPELSSMLSAGLPGGAFDANCLGLFLLASDGGARAAMQGIFGV